MAAQTKGWFKTSFLSFDSGKWALVLIFSGLGHAGICLCKIFNNIMHLLTGILRNLFLFNKL